MVAAALQISAVDVEVRFLRLADENRFVRVAGSEEWPDGTASFQFSFLHDLYRELWQERPGRGRSQEWHLRIAECLENAYANQAGAIAPRLATHFEMGRDYSRAIAYRADGSRLALQRTAHVEARAHLDRALELLTKLAEGPKRSRRELRLQIDLGTILALAGGYGSPDAADAFRRAQDICRRLGETPD